MQWDMSWPVSLDVQQKTVQLAMITVSVWHQMAGCKVPGSTHVFLYPVAKGYAEVLVPYNARNFVCHHHTLFRFSSALLVWAAMLIGQQQHMCLWLTSQSCK
jgi:hypothetical protein